MKVKCMIDKTRYSNKPQGYEIGKIQNRMSPIEIDIRELANLLVEGCSFKPALLKGRKDSDWMSQQIFALDFDEETTIEEELIRCKDLKLIPSFGYTSFNHTENQHKFRLVFCFNKFTDDLNEAIVIQLTLMKLFDKCDKQCKNLSRLFYGGKNIIYDEFDNIIDYDWFKNTFDNIINKLKEDNESREKSPYNNNDIYYNTSIIVGDKSNDETYYNIKAVRDRNAEYLTNKLNMPKKICINNRDYMDYIRRIDLGALLEYKYPSSIKCLFHDDNNPSAGIFKNDEGIWLYKCFGCGVEFNILQVIEMLGNFKSRPKAHTFIREIFNIEMAETKWQKDQKEILDQNLDSLICGEFEQLCPETYKNIKRNMKYIIKMNMLAKKNVSTEKMTDDEGNVLFFASTRYIAREMGMSENSAKEISKKNVLFQYHNMLNKLDDSEIHDDFINRWAAISINSDAENKKYKHVNCYSIPSYTTSTLLLMEEQGKKWKENNYSMSGCSREMFFRTEGKEVADILYPQYKKIHNKDSNKIEDRTTSKISDDRTMIIVHIIMEKIGNKNYVTENEIVKILIGFSDMYISEKSAKAQLKKSLQEILDTYNLKRIRSNKELKDKYGISGNGYPFLIVKNKE